MLEGRVIIFLLTSLFPHFQLPHSSGLFIRNPRYYNPVYTMSTRTQSHQLNSGLFVSGRPPNSLRTPTVSSLSVPYTGGDLSKSGELAKMFDISSSQPSTPKPPSRPPSQPNSGSGPQSGPPLPSSLSQPNSGSGPLSVQPYFTRHSQPNSGSGPQIGPGHPSRLGVNGSGKKASGPISLHPTGLITSGPLTSTGGPVGSGGMGRRSGQLEGQPGSNSGKMVYGAAVTNMGKEKVRYGVRVSRGVMWGFVIVILMGLLVGVFLMVAVKKPVILVAVVAVLVPVLIGFVWNYAWKRRAVLGFVARFPDTELRGAVDGQFVKVTGIVTCGSIPLESSFQREPRCVYVSTELYEYKGWAGKAANSEHRCFSWRSRHSEKYVADFYVSDFHSGLRALVKSGYGAKVALFVEPATVVDVSKKKRDLSPNFLQWLADRSLSSDDRVMRLKEGYVKEGSTVSVMGVVRRHENIVMIVPPEEPISTGCQWLRCLLPMYVEGLILHCEDSQNSEVIPV